MNRTSAPTDAALVNQAYAEAMLAELGTFFDASIIDPAGAKDRMLRGLPIIRAARTAALDALNKSSEEAQQERRS